MLNKTIIKKHIFTTTRFLLVTSVFFYLIYSVVPGCVTPISDKNKFNLKVTPVGPNEQTWIGPNGKTHIITWEEPIYRIRTK